MEPQRNSRARATGVVAAGAVLALLISSCSSDGSGDETEPSATASTSATASASASRTATASAPASPGPSGTTPGATPTGPVVAERDEPLVQRVSYPVRGIADPSQNWGDLYLPAGKHAEKSVPLVVLIHGGSWQDQAGAKDFESYAESLVDRGMAVYNIEYRRVGSGGGWPTTFTDVASALDFVPELSRQHPEFTTDDELVVGHSAGAQLAMWSGTRDSAEEHELGAHPKFVPTRVVSLAGPLDMVYAAEHGDDRIEKVLGGTPQQVPERYSDVDPIQNIDTTLPVVAIHGTKDTTVAPENSRRYIDAVTQQGGQGSLHLMDGEDHGSLIDAKSSHYDEILDLIDQTADAPVERVASAAAAP